MKKLDQELEQIYATLPVGGFVDYVNGKLRTGELTSADLLFGVIWHKNIEMFRRTLRANIDVHATNRAGQTPLYAYSIARPNEESFRLTLCELLVDRGADVNFRHTIRYEAPKQRIDGSTCLMAAAGNNSVTIINFLLRKGADPSFVDSRGETALAIAARWKFKESVTVLERWMKLGRNSTSAPT